MRPRPMTEPRLPHSRSTGSVRSSRLGCPMSSKGWSKGLGRVSSFLRCFAYFSNMTSRTCRINRNNLNYKHTKYLKVYPIDTVKYTQLQIKVEEEFRQSVQQWTGTRNSWNVAWKTNNSVNFHCKERLTVNLQTASTKSESIFRSLKTQDWN